MRAGIFIMYTYALMSPYLAIPLSSTSSYGLMSSISSLFRVEFSTREDVSRPQLHDGIELILHADFVGSVT